ncbi:armadillo repeat-containing protein 2 isoform X2 [Nilaparvata lugens]|uniref:armadillo repeat-containing protein 2 isoform X2 n=1 Tax=Nilaparvata lugens TaxID=108931 RepID=UPI00193D78EE|nr:armadillo repeat-containing protein 2 isoform X2 [Nilaparvata lugens]
MDGSLLKPRRPLRSLAAQVPFYQPPFCLAKTSAQIISEARVAMTTSQHSVAMATSQHPVNTKRPFTPRDAGRVLFGAGRMRRPPSAVSIRQVHFHDVDSNVLPKLVDLDQTKNNANNQNGAGALTLSGVALLKTQNGRWRLPAIPQKNAHNQLEKLPEEQTTPKKPLQPKPPETKPEAPPILDSTTTNQRPPKEDSFMRMRRLTQQKVVGMDQLMAWSEIADLADEDNRINEARAADVTKQQLNQSADVTNHQLLQSDNVKQSEDMRNQLQDSADVRDQLQDSADVANQLLQSADESVEAALERIALLQGSNCDADLSCALDQLYSAVEREGDRIIRNHRAKAAILRALHPFIEVSSEALLLRLARVILALRVTGQNLSAICKIVFKVSRSDKHDDYFLENNILALFVESLGRASPLEDAEACIYGYGALKFLTMNSALSAALLQLGLLQLIVLHMKIVNNSRLELSPIAEPTSHALFQLTGALRNLASDSTQYAALLQTGAITQLCRSLQLFSADLDLVCNISRTLSIISTNDGCCKEIVDCEDGFKTMTKILRKFPGRQDVVVRLGYAMGNAVAKSNSARIKLYQEPEALKVILDLMESYLEKDLQESMSEDINGNNTNLQQQIGSDGSVEDVLIKMIRIIANMSLHPDVGVGLACAFDADEMDSEFGFTVNHTQNKKDAERLISMLLKVLRRKSATESEELVISALSTFNNLSYYAASSTSPDSPFAVRNIELAEALGHLLTTDNEECLTEVARVLGNLTRSRQVRDFLLETGGVSSLTRCLLRDNVELLSATAGVLVNLMADWDKRLALKEDNGISRLIWVLGRWGVGDWRLANLICQVLWNFCIDSTDLCAAFGIRPINLLLATLIELLDEERLFGVTEEGDADEAVLCSGEYRQWEQFALVATNLLEKIELCLQPQTTDAVMTSSMSSDVISDVIDV